MEIIKGPTYPEANHKICKECSCEFKHLDNEIEHGGDEIMGGYGFWSSVRCPGCNTSILLNSQFIEDDDWLENLLNWFARIRLKWQNRQAARK